MLAQLETGVSEIMCHPGYVDDALRQSSGYLAERERELDALTHPDVLAKIQELEIQLVRFSNAWLP
jgi:predicted glycoside hydrolase/deacetylase ChbG (UPF0249 family)